MLSLAAESVGLHWRSPPSPKCLRLNDWFLGAKANFRQSPQVLFFPEVYVEVTSSWRAPFSARNRASASSIFTALDGRAAKWYVKIPSAERVIAVQFFPWGAASWQGNPRIPSRARGFSSFLTAKAYRAAGQASSALYAMALLQTYQAKALKQLYEGSSDPGLMQELRTVTDLALRATKVTAWSLGQTMSTLVVQEQHLWLDLADMSKSNKHRFLNSPISQAGLSGDAMDSFAQQFSISQRRTEAIGDILPWWPAAVITLPPVAAPLPALRQRRPPAAPSLLQRSPSSSLHSGRSVELAAEKWHSPSLPLPGLGSARASGIPGTGEPETLGPALQEMVSPLFPPVGFWVVQPLVLRQVVPKPSEQFSLFPIPKGARMAVHETQSRHPVPLFFREWVAGSGPRTRCLLLCPLPSRGAR